MPPDVETAIYRVVQEAINNIARHACARNVALTLEFANNRVEIQIVDDGKGFDSASSASAPNGKRGLGLMGMKERMSVIGGELHLQSQPGKGTAIHLIVPLQQGSNGKD